MPSVNSAGGGEGEGKDQDYLISHIRLATNSKDTCATCRSSIMLFTCTTGNARAKR